MDEQALKEITEYMIAESKRDKEQKYEKYRRLNAFCEKGQILFTGSSLMEFFPIVELAEGVVQKRSTTAAWAVRRPLSSSTISTPCSSICSPPPSF